MDAITRIKLQRQPKKDFLQETLDNVQAQVNPSAKNTENITVPYNATTTAPAKPQAAQKQATIQTATANVKQPENALNQAEQQAVNNPTPEQIAENNQIAGVKEKAGVPDNYVKPTPVDFGAKLTTENAKQILDEQGLPGLWNALNKESAYEGQDAIDNREKKEKQRALISSIADGLSAIANIGGTLAGGVAQKQSSLSDANMKRREYQRQIREREREKWQQMMLRTGENQQNYELARKRQEIQYQDNLLKHQYNQQKLDLEKLTQMRLMAESNKKADYYDAMIKTKQAQIDKTMSDIENNRARTNSYISTNQTRANASQTSANASALRASSTAAKNKAEITGRKDGWWNKNDKSSGSEPPQSKYTPTTEEKPKPTPAPRKQAATKSQPAKTTNTGWLGEYGYKSNNKKHQKNPFE